MAKEAKTTPTSVGVADYLASVTNRKLAQDGERLIELFEEISRNAAVMWGSSIIGFGTYHYTYDSGHSGTYLRTGFAIRGTGLVIYLLAGLDVLTEELKSIGPYKAGKSCLYIKNLERTNISALKDLIGKSLDIMESRYPTDGSHSSR